MMHVTLDTQQMRSCMELWRHELTIPQSAQDLANGGRAQRAKILADLNGTLSGWLDLLRLCTVSEIDRRALGEITQEVASFKDWVGEAGMAVSLMQGARSIGRGRSARRRKE